MTKSGDNSSTRKTRVVKKSASKSVITREDRVLEKLLIENFISMQKVMSSLTIKFDHLSNQIEGLLSLFESSAKAVAQKEISLELKGDTEKQEEVLEKLKLLLDQNKLIAKGITLVHESSKESREPVPASPKPLSQGFKVKPASMEHDEQAPISTPSPNAFSASKDTSLEPQVKTTEEEGLPPRPSFSI